MSKIDTIQTSFVGGEFAPALFGRTDVAQYQTACALVENFLIRPYGSLISTPGTEFINACKTGGSTSVVGFIEFVFSRTDSFIIEVGVGYFRFFNNGAVVVSTGTTPYEVAHTYTAAEIFDIQFAQLNDVIYLDHANHAPATLTRVSAAAWTLGTLAFTGGPYLPLNKTTTTITPSASVGSITLSASANIFTPSSSATVLGHVNTFWAIGSTRTSAATGLDVQGYVQITAITNPSTATATVIQTLSTTSATVIWQEGSWSSVRGWPSRITFHQQRLCHARTTAQPQNVWASKSFTYENYAVDGGEDDDALDLQLTSTESNDIKWLVSGDSLVAGTYGGEFVIKTGDDSPLTPSTTNVQKQTSWGSEAVPPKRIGNYFYYIQRFGTKLRELFFIWDVNAYKSLDKTILSPHISGSRTRASTTANTGFISLAYQQNPDTVLWAVCSNGSLATLTREVDQQVQGWARQTTDGIYEAIGCIPSQNGPYDEVWVVVKRTINGSSVRYIERFKSQEIPERQDQCFYVHCGLTYDAYAATSASTSSSLSMNHTAGTSVLFTCSSARFVAGSVGKRIRAIDSDGNTLGEAKIVGYTSSTIVVADIKSAFSAPTYAAGSWGLSVTTLSGLNHLEAKTVTVLADGGLDKPSKTVSGGSITLAYDYFLVNVGLPYTQTMKTLPQEAGSQRGTSQGKKQRINEVGFKVNRSFKGFMCGGTEDYLTQIQFRDPATLMGSPEALYTGTIPNIPFTDDLQYGSQVLIENSEPLPIELLSLITTIETFDK